MKGKALFAVGVAVGYVWGSKSWPEVYRRIRGGTEKVLKNPDVQENVHQAAETVQDTVPDILENLYEAGKKLMEKAEAVFPGLTAPKGANQSSGPQSNSGGNEPKVATVPVATAAPHVASDVVSDPALDDTTGTDWTDEGGAAPEGPATNTPPRH